MLKGKKVIVTGGSSGIGKAIAKTFAMQGANVLITGRNISKLEFTVNTINSSLKRNQGKLDYLQWDITDVKNIDTYLEQCISMLNGLDILVCNAGIFPGVLDFSNTTVEQFENTLLTNLEGPFFLASKTIHYMSSCRVEGNIIFIASETADVATTNPYGLSKCALVNFAKGIAYDKKTHGVRCNVISPGITVSNINNRDTNGDLSAQTINGRLLLSDEIAQTALFLACDVSKCINGEVIRCNEGNTINVEYFRR